MRSFVLTIAILFYIFSSPLSFFSRGCCVCCCYIFHFSFHLYAEIGGIFIFIQLTYLLLVTTHSHSIWFICVAEQGHGLHFFCVCHYYWCWSQTTRYLPTLSAFATCKISSHFAGIKKREENNFFFSSSLQNDNDESTTSLYDGMNAMRAQYISFWCFIFFIAFFLVIEMWNQLEKCYYNTSIQWLWFTIFFSSFSLSSFSGAASTAIIYRNCCVSN